jgi:hypothetical protein
MTVLGASILTVAHLSIARSLHFSVDGRWAIAAYTITVGGSPLLGGRRVGLLVRGLTCTPGATVSGPTPACVRRNAPLARIV